MLDNTNDRWASSDTNALSDCSGGEGKLLSRVLAVVAGCPSVVPKLWHAPESPGGLLKYRVLALPPEFLTQPVWEQVQEFASPSPTPHSQRLLLLS